jgi:hypothetical protein
MWVYILVYLFGMHTCIYVCIYFNLCGWLVSDCSCVLATLSANKHMYIYYRTNVRHVSPYRLICLPTRQLIRRRGAVDGICIWRSSMLGTLNSLRDSTCQLKTGNVALQTKRHLMIGQKTLYVVPCI